MKPGDFFIGVTDFFSVLVPGAGITFIGVFWGKQLDVPPDHVLAAVLGASGAVGWAAFLVISYFLGHVTVSLGARLDTLYEARKEGHQNTALEERAEKELDAFLNECGATHSMRTARPSTSRFAQIASVILVGSWRVAGPVPPPPSSCRLMNAYKFARVSLNCQAPTVYAEVLRLEADSKFFRSLVVVATFATFTCAVQLVSNVYGLAIGAQPWTLPAWGAAYLVFVFLVARIAFTRFCDLRLKATETAFQGLIVVRAAAPKASRVRRKSPMIG